MSEDYILGIDLGTTYCCAGVWIDGKIAMIPLENENETMPSVVAFTPEGILYGYEAKDYTNVYPELVISNCKRMIGRRFNDRVIQSDMKYWPFKVIEKNNGKCYIHIDNGNDIVKDFRPEEIQGMLLSNIKEYAEDFIGQKISQAVITVPANFNDSQRQATMTAATLAGLKVKRIINEPTAAAIAYGLDKRMEEKENILVVDLGGGTTDISLLTIHNGKIEVKATDGDNHLGGEDFDNRLLLHFVNEFKRKYNIDLTKSPKAMRRLKSSCEKIKHTLSSLSTTKLSLNLIYEDIDFESHITRDRFEELNMDLFEKIIEVIDSVIRDSKIPKSLIQKVVLVGGSSKIPKIRSLISEFFEGKELYTNIDPDKAVAHGATIFAASLSEERTNRIQDIVLMDVTPLSLGVETEYGVMTTFFNRNTPIPAKKTLYFTTIYKGQKNVIVSVYEGEWPTTKNNNLLGEFMLSGISTKYVEVPIIEVTMEIDQNSILNISAIDTESGKCNKITIVNNKDRLSEKEIEQMIKEFEKFKVNQKK
jgi:L1 cell adhesion molecule like protein